MANCPESNMARTVTTTMCTINGDVAGALVFGVCTNSVTVMVWRFIEPNEQR